MSAPKRAMRDAEEISYGFLATRASMAIGNAISNRMSQDDRAILERAAALLSEIASGALRTKGTLIEGVRPSKSIAALNVALGPLENLKNLVHENAEIAPVFNSLATAVKAVHRGESPSTLEPDISHARQFFDELSGWLESELAKRKKLGFHSRGRASA